MKECIEKIKSLYAQNTALPTPASCHCVQNTVLPTPAPRHCERSAAIQSSALRHCERSAAIQPNKVSTKFATILLTLSLLLPLTSCKKEDTNPNQKTTIKIGAFLPLTGNNALFGNTYKNMFSLKVEEANKASSKYNYKLFAEDDQFELKKSMLTARSLMNVDDVDFIFGSSSGAELGLVGDVTRNKTILFSNLWDDEAPKKSKYVFQYMISPHYHVKLLLSEMSKRNIKTVSFIGTNHRGTLLALKELKEQSKAFNIKVIDENLVNPDEKDFGTLVYKANLKNPDIYVIILWDKGMELVSKEFFKYNIKTPITSIDMLDFVKDKSMFEGCWYVSDSIPNSDLEKKYKEKFGEELLFTQSSWGYAVLDAVIDIYEKYDKKPSIDVIVDELLELKNKESYVGSIGYDKDGILNGKPILKTIKNGKAVLMEEN
ncbi:MAG: ABC transporter substrate-binding protein [Alphaproteobacteria bacterium]